MQSTIEYANYVCTHTLSTLGVGNTRDSLRLSARSASDGPTGSAGPLQM